VPPSAQLPEKPVGAPVGEAVKGMEAGKGGVWSVQYERQLVSQLEASERKIVEMIEEEKSAGEARRARMAELGKKIDAKG
jgi:YEATS domain-containing protein 4